MIVPAQLTFEEFNFLNQTRQLTLDHLHPGLQAKSSPTPCAVTREQLFLLAGKIGLLGLQVPAAYGGRAFSFNCKVQAAEILAGADFGFAMAILNSHNVALQLCRLAQPELITRLIPHLLTGKHIGCTALTEPGAGSDFSAIQMQAVAVQGGWELHGEKRWIVSANYADVMVVYAQTQAGTGAAGVAAFVVEASKPGFERLPIADTSPRATIGTGGFRLNAYRCTPIEMLCPPGAAFKDILQAINGARTYVAAMCCGMVKQALEEAVVYGRTRHTFGKPLLGHQGWRWQLANAAVDLEAACLLVSKAAALEDAGQSTQVAAAMAKVFATRMAQKHIPGLMHAMGAEGLNERYVFARHTAAVQMAGLVDGSTEMMLERISQEFRPS